MSKRIITGIVLTPIVIAVILLANGTIFYIMTQAALLLALYEFYKLADGIFDRTDFAAGTIFSALTGFVFVFHPEFRVPVLLLSVLIPFTYVVIRVVEVNKSAWRASLLLSGQIYVAIGGIMLAALFADFEGVGRVALARKIILLAVAIVWLGDSAAYFGGVTLGRHKLHEAVSPRKTWEGSIAGVAGSVAGAFLVKHIFSFHEISISHLLAFSISAAIIAQIGDLAESLFKRQFGVKDSGRIIPGHGGMLDRIDALLFVAPWCWIYFRYIWV